MVLSKYQSPPPPESSPGPFQSYSSSDSVVITDVSSQSDEDVPSSNRGKKKPTPIPSSSQQEGSSQGNSQTMRPTTRRNLNKEVRVTLTRIGAQKQQQQQASASSSGGENSQRVFDQGPNPRALRLHQQEQNKGTSRKRGFHQSNVGEQVNPPAFQPASTSTPSSSNKRRRSPRSPRDPNVGASRPDVNELLQRAEDVETNFGQIMRSQRYQFQKFAQIINDLREVKEAIVELRVEHQQDDEATRQTLAAHEARLIEIQNAVQTLLARGQAAPQQGQLRQVDYICIDGHHRFRFPLQIREVNGMIHYLCPRCPALFKSPEGLRRHIRKGNRTCTCQCEGTPSP